LRLIADIGGYIIRKAEVTTRRESDAILRQLTIDELRSLIQASERQALPEPDTIIEGDYHEAEG